MNGIMINFDFEVWITEFVRRKNRRHEIADANRRQSDQTVINTVEEAPAFDQRQPVRRQNNKQRGTWF